MSLRDLVAHMSIALEAFQALNTGGCHVLRIYHPVDHEQSDNVEKLQIKDVTVPTNC